MQSGRSAAWTKERIDALSTPEIRQLRDNAQRLGEAEIVGLCEEILKGRPKTGSGLPKPGAGLKTSSGLRSPAKRKAAA